MLPGKSRAIKRVAVFISHPAKYYFFYCRSEEPACRILSFNAVKVTVSKVAVEFKSMTIIMNNCRGRRCIEKTSSEKIEEIQVRDQKLPDKISEIYRQEDYDFYDHELASFVPDRIYDSHIHLWSNRYDGFPQSIPTPVDVRRYVKVTQDLFGNRRVSGLLIPFPSNDNRDEEDAWVSEQMKAAVAIDPAYRYVMLVAPGDD